MNILQKSFYERSSELVARELLGKIVVGSFNNQIISGIISETEAYGGENDPASHCYKGLTLRNKAMFGPVGHSYVYFIYGNHYCLNIVSKDKNAAAGGVLLRGLIPHKGIELMQTIRKTTDISNLTNGPGKIGQIFGLTLEHNHIDITNQSSYLFVTEGVTINPDHIIATPRIGISKAQDTLWRFIIDPQMIFNFK